MISYAGNTLYPFSFGLYDIDCDFEASKEQKHLRNTTRAINKICKLRSD